MEIKNIELMQQKIYEQELNYEEEYPHSEGKKCYIFFSSNGIDKNISEDKYWEELVEKNKFEWQSIANSLKYHKDLGKIIYVRDIYKKFYIDGININIDTIDKLLDLLNEAVKGYEVTTVGISSGGYLATISAIQLKAERAFCISGQFDIHSHLRDVNVDLLSLDKKKYLNIQWLLKDNVDTPVYYFCPIGCAHDWNNYQLVRNDKNVKSFMFPDKVHAATVYPFNFPDILFKSNQKLDSLFCHYENKVINKNEFYLRTVTYKGLLTFIKHIWTTRFNLGKLRKKWEV